MKTIKVVFNKDSSMQPVAIDFKVYRGEYNQVELLVYIPKSLLLDTVKDENGNILTGNTLKVGAILHKANGQAYTTQDYALPVLQEQVIDNTVYVVYCRKLPKEFTLWETVATELGERGELQMVFNLLQTRQENDKTIIESILTSPIVALPIYASAYLAEDTSIEGSKIDELAGNVDSLRLTVQNDMATKVELNTVDTNKVDKLQVEAGKLLLSNGNGGIQASDVGIQEYENQKGYIDQLHSEQEQRMNRLQTEISANTNERHVHINKEILDGYTVPNSELLECVDKMHEHANKEILDSITEAFTTALKGNVESSISNVEIDSNTGIFTFTKHNGEKVTVDTLLEKVIVNFEFDPNTKSLVLISEDGTRQEIELGALLSMYNGTDGAEIAVTIDRDNNIGASIKAGAVTTSKLADNAVTEQKLAPNILESIQIQFATMQAEIEAIRADREQVIKDSWLYAHPIGSCILTMGEENPNDRGGAWELVQAGRALWTTQGINAGQTIEAGLPNITGGIPNGRLLGDGPYDGTFKNGMVTDTISQAAIGGGNGYKLHALSFDASKSNAIYGKSNTVQPPAIKIRLWKRKA